MRILSLDLGITTGWCVREFDGELVAYGTIKYLEDDALLEHDFHSLIQRYLPSYVVIESPVLVVRGELGGKLAALIASAKRVFRNNTEQCTPAQWKPRYGSLQLPFKGASQHERDAYRICEWWLKTKAPLSNV